MTRHKAQDIEARNYKFFLFVVAKKTATGSILGNFEKFTGKHMCQSLTKKIAKSSGFLDNLI